MKINPKTWFILLAIVLSSCQSPLFVSHVTPAPTPQCVEPTLTLGTTKFQIDSIPREANKFPEIPNRKKGIAYWVEGTSINYVFGLSPIKDNLALNTALKAGDPAIINWADCTKDEYVVKSIDSAQPNDLKIFDQSAGGLTVYVQTDSSNLVIHGERSNIQPVGTALPVPTEQFQIDVTLQDQPPTNDQTVKIGLTIANKGQQTITLRDKDVSLTAENNPEGFPTNVEPALPQDIAAGANVQIVATFPKPQAKTAVLRIFDLTFDYYFQ